MKEKINREGCFQPFNGTSVVMPVIQNLPLEVKMAELSSHSSIAPFYSFLPSNSLHITAFNLYVQNLMSDEMWRQSTTKNLDFYSSIQFTLSEEFKDINQFDLTILPRGICDGVLQLVVTIPEEIYETVQAIAAKYNIEHKIPDFFHMTLAYQYRPFPSQVSADAAGKTFHTFLSEIQEMDVQASPAQLTFFHDMTKFNPWDGSFNPFGMPEPESTYEKVQELVGSPVKLAQKQNKRVYGRVFSGQSPSVDESPELGHAMLKSLAHSPVKPARVRKINNNTDRRKRRLGLSFYAEEDRASLTASLDRPIDNKKGKVEQIETDNTNPITTNYQ